MVLRFRTLAAIAVVGLLAVAGAAAFAQGPGGPGGPGRRGPGAGRGGPQAALPLRALDLTDAQRDQVRQLTEQHREQSRDLLERVRAARDAQRKAGEAVPFSEQDVRAAAQALGELESELAVSQARLQSEIQALLTPEQQQKLQTMRAERAARAKQREERFRQRQQGQARPQA